LVSPVRRLSQDPGKILAPYVNEGAIVLEPGPGMGFFTVEMARRVGPKGRVIAIDVQPRMIASLKRRLKKAGLAERVEVRLASPESMGLAEDRGSVDLVVAFAVVHGFPDPRRFFAEVTSALKPGGGVLLAEPLGHVKPPEFEVELEAPARVGLSTEARPSISRSQAAWLRKH
jgi:ubiquinone/menaquinone biosynthesis C-methylase UbiE